MLSNTSFAAMIPIKDMDRAIKFYTGTIGGKLNMRAEGDMKDAWASVNVGKTEFWLVQPQKREKIELAYNTFIVKDIKEAVTGLKKKKVKFLPAEKMGHETKIDGPIAYSPYGANAFFKDSEGNTLMLWETAPEHQHR